MVLTIRPTERCTSIPSIAAKNPSATSTRLDWAWCRNFTKAAPTSGLRQQLQTTSTHKQRQKMELKPRKRALEDVHGHNGDEAPLKRRRQINEEQLKLSKLYENLAAESDEVRIDAAKQLIVKFSAENKPAAYDVKSAINRLIKGLCSQRKAARVGFSLTLTELLRQLFGQDSNPVADSDLRVASIIKLVEENTKVEGNVPGKVSPPVSPKE
jgi:hypothetical protein